MEKSRKREAFEAIALVAWTLFSGGAGMVAERYHADGQLAVAAAELSSAKSEAEISKAEIVAAQEEREAAKWRLMESEQRERELKRQLELVLAAQSGGEELAKAVKELTGKIKTAPAKIQKPAEKLNLEVPPSTEEADPQATVATAATSAVSWQQQMLDEHNRWRAVVDVPPLAWSAELERSAQQVADQLAANGCELKRSGSKNGENLHKSVAVKWTDGRIEHSPKSPAQIVAAWGSDADSYRWIDNTCTGVCGHYTQMVWKDTKAVGCAHARCANNGDITACQYNPPGNFVGQRPF